MCILMLECKGLINYCMFTLKGESPLKGFHNGDKIQVKILGFRDVKTHK